MIEWRKAKQERKMKGKRDRNEKLKMERNMEKFGRRVKSKVKSEKK